MKGYLSVEGRRFRFRQLPNKRRKPLGIQKFFAHRGNKMEGYLSKYSTIGLLNLVHSLKEKWPMFETLKISKAVWHETYRELILELRSRGVRRVPRTYPDTHKPINRK